MKCKLTSFVFVLTVIVMIGTRVALVGTAYADRNTTASTLAVSPVNNITPAKRVVVKKQCSKRCLDRKVEEIVGVMSKATAAKSGGLTKYTCKQVQERVNEIVADLPENVILTFDQGWDDFPCMFVYIGPRVHGE